MQRRSIQSLSCQARLRSNASQWPRLPMASLTRADEDEVLRLRYARLRRLAPDRRRRLAASRSLPNGEGDLPRNAIESRGLADEQPGARLLRQSGEIDVHVVAIVSIDDMSREHT
jgi:hypothetical protein